MSVTDGLGTSPRELSRVAGALRPAGAATKSGIVGASTNTGVPAAVECASVPSSAISAASSQTSCASPTDARLSATARGSVTRVTLVTDEVGGVGRKWGTGGARAVIVASPSLDSLGDTTGPRNDGTSPRGRREPLSSRCCAARRC